MLQIGDKIIAQRIRKTNLVFDGLKIEDKVLSSFTGEIKEILSVIEYLKKTQYKTEEDLNSFIDTVNSTSSKDEAEQFLNEKLYLAKIIDTNNIKINTELKENECLCFMDSVNVDLELNIGVYIPIFNRNNKCYIGSYTVEKL